MFRWPGACQITAGWIKDMSTKAEKFNEYGVDILIIRCDQLLYGPLYGPDKGFRTSSRPKELVIPPADCRGLIVQLMRVEGIEEGIISLIEIKPTVDLVICDVCNGTVNDGDPHYNCHSPKPTKSNDDDYTYDDMGYSDYDK